MPIQELFGAINYGLVTVLRLGICVQWYHYVERDPQAWQTSMRHVLMLLPTLTIQGYRQSLLSNIKLLGPPISTRIGFIHSRSFLDGHVKVFHNLILAMDFLTLYQQYFGS
jgi:hypothetical protein